MKVSQNLQDRDNAVDPRLIEGSLIAGRVNGARAYIYVLGEFFWRHQIFNMLNECYQAGLIGKTAVTLDTCLDIFLHRAGAYICGEEQL